MQDPATISDLLAIMARLRDPANGCPWDLKQSFRTILPYTLEEAYEVAEAIEQDDMGDLRDELGDLLFQVVFHAQMAREQGSFDFSDVVRGICDKMLRRHSHVFAEAVFADEHRHLGVDAEQALRAANHRFEWRFGRVESGLREQRMEPGVGVREEMERLWEAAKAEERG